MARKAGDPAPHGTRARYYATGASRCRCDKCTAANTKYMRLVRAAAEPRTPRPVQLRLPVEVLRRFGVLDD